MARRSQTEVQLITSADLTDREFEEYKILQHEWAAEKKEYQKKEEALIQL